jgi:hypothetical protein
LVFEKEVYMTNTNPLSEKTAAEIESLSRKISVAQELDGEIQAELRGHIEDKVRGYASGKIKVSEADAMLLAKAHFGNAAVIKGMFQGVHTKAHAVSLVRRLVAVFVMTVWVWTIMTNVDTLWDGWFAFYGAKEVKSNHIPISRLPDVAVKFVLILASITILWRVLAYGRARANRGHRLWFENWSPMTLGLILAGSVLYSMDLSHLCIEQFRVFIENIDPQAIFQPSLIWTILVRWIFPSLFFIAIGLLWIWSCDHTPRRWQTIVAGGIAWLIAYQVLLTARFSAGNVVFIDDPTIRHFLLMFSDFIRPLLLMNLLFNVPLLFATIGGYLYYTRRRAVLVG